MGLGLRAGVCRSLCWGPSRGMMRCMCSCALTEKRLSAGPRRSSMSPGEAWRRGWGVGGRGEGRGGLGVG